MQPFRLFLWQPKQPDFGYVFRSDVAEGGWRFVELAHVCRPLRRRHRHVPPSPRHSPRINFWNADERNLAKKHAL